MFVLFLPQSYVCVFSCSGFAEPLRAVLSMLPGDGMRCTSFQGEFVHIFHS